jgi:hypothetical protein
VCLAMAVKAFRAGECVSNRRSDVADVDAKLPVETAATDAKVIASLEPIRRCHLVPSSLCSSQLQGNGCVLAEIARDAGQRSPEEASSGCSLRNYLRSPPRDSAGTVRRTFATVKRSRFL